MKKIFNLVLGVCLLMSVLLTPVLAEEASPAFSGKFEQGVGNVTIYIDSDSGANYWQVYITGAANNWMYPGSGMSNPIYMQFVSSTYGSKIDVYCQNDSYWTNQGYYDVLAETKHYYSGVVIHPNSRNWSFTEIHINDDNFRLSSFTNDQAQGTMIHEMGHTLGLNENNDNPYSVMCQLGAGRIVQRVQECDNNAIKAKYN